MIKKRKVTDIRQFINTELYSSILSLNQKFQIELAASENINLMHYCDENFDYAQMREIRLGLKYGVDVRYYNQVTIPAGYMIEFRIALRQGLDIDTLYKYLKVYPVEIFRQLRMALNKKVDITKYLDKGLDGKQLEQIRIGIINGINPDEYAKKEYTVYAMRQARNCIDSPYRNHKNNELVNKIVNIMKKHPEVVKRVFKHKPKLREDLS